MLEVLGGKLAVVPHASDLGEASGCSDHLEAGDVHHPNLGGPLLSTPKNRQAALIYRADRQLLGLVRMVILDERQHWSRAGSLRRGESGPSSAPLVTGQSKAWSSILAPWIAQSDELVVRPGR